MVIISINKTAFEQSYGLTKFSVKIGHFMCNVLIHQILCFSLLPVFYQTPCIIYSMLHKLFILSEGGSVLRSVSNVHTSRDICREAFLKQWASAHHHFKRFEKQPPDIDFRSDSQPGQPFHPFASHSVPLLEHSFLIFDWALYPALSKVPVV